MTKVNITENILIEKGFEKEIIDDIDRGWFIKNAIKLYSSIDSLRYNIYTREVWIEVGGYETALRDDVWFIDELEDVYKAITGVLFLE